MVRSSSSNVSARSTKYKAVTTQGYSVTSGITKTSRAAALLGKSSSSRADALLGKPSSSRADALLGKSSAVAQHIPQHTPVVESKTTIPPQTARRGRAALQVAVATGSTTEEEAKRAEKKLSWKPKPSSRFDFNRPAWKHRTMGAAYPKHTSQHFLFPPDTSESTHTGCVVPETVIISRSHAELLRLTMPILLQDSQHGQHLLLERHRTGLPT